MGKKIKFGQGIELEREEEGEYILRFRTPHIKIIPADLTGGHLKQAKREVLLAIRSILDKAIKVEEEKDKD